MNINLDITDQQAANLAALHHVPSFTDGNDLLTQVLADSDLQTAKRGLIGAIATSQDANAVNAAIGAWNTVATPISQPPIRIKPS